MFNKNSFVSKCSALVFGLITASQSLAQRVTQEDIYGDSYVSSDGSVLGYVGLLITAGLVLWGVVTNKGFRLGVLAYAGFLGGILLIFKSFGKDVGIIACVIVMLILFFLDPSNRKK